MVTSAIYVNIEFHIKQGRMMDKRKNTRNVTYLHQLDIGQIPLHYSDVITG